MVRLMALDVGAVRIGVAVSGGLLAAPYTTLHVSQDEEQTFAAIQRLIEETGAESLVVGLPISLDGQIHMQGERVQAFVERLRPYITIPLTFWDERLSTVEAQRLRTQQGGGAGRRQPERRQAKKRRKGHEIDALAATVILQEYLDSLGRKTEEEEQV
ncbi:MAG TPA: Holliday junction resolvase RuvX [Ktedonobacteraceae bacterium]|nr:Holliday junction resolvase RuvX [Ktedonobacteraceae bacterium]